MSSCSCRSTLPCFFDTLRSPARSMRRPTLLLGSCARGCAFLCDVGLGYLTLDRQSRTLSGGEVQRINLTTALGTSLVNTLFVLDEPSIGLHPRDMRRVIGVMQRLRDAGNTLLVVEHDPQIMLEADRILDLGPGAGEHGGHIVCYGTPARSHGAPHSGTGAWLAGRRRLHAGRRGAQRAMPDGSRTALRIRLTGAAEHNLQQLDVEMPLHRLVCLTGVSRLGQIDAGAGRALPGAAARRMAADRGTGRFRSLEGARADRCGVLIDQAPIGRTTRSNPASYVGAFDEIRARFAADAEAKLRNYTAGTFSFNSGKGRCPACGGNGFEHVEMQFLSDVYLRCGDCHGTPLSPRDAADPARGAPTDSAPTSPRCSI